MSEDEEDISERVDTASVKNEAIEEVEKPDEQLPLDLSDDEDNPEFLAASKKELLEWVTEADFAKEISLTTISSHKFKLDNEEVEAMIGTEGILKICKV